MWSKTERPVEGPRAKGTSEPVASEPRHMEPPVAVIGSSLHLTGELTGAEDVLIEGTVEGKIELKDHTVTIGLNGCVRAELHAKTVIIFGEATGNVFAGEKVELRGTGKLRGDLHTPRLVVADGAMLKGTVVMEQAGEAASRDGVGVEWPDEYHHTGATAPASAAP